MDKNNILTSYLECKKIELNKEFPKYIDITSEAFFRVNALLNMNFEGYSDNRVYRYILDDFKKLIIFLFEKDTSKVYLRSFFKIINNKIIIEHLSLYAQSKSRNIQNATMQFVHFFTATWQGCNHNREVILTDIINRIESWK